MLLDGEGSDWSDLGCCFEAFSSFLIPLVSVEDFVIGPLSHPVRHVLRALDVPAGSNFSHYPLSTFVVLLVSIPRPSRCPSSAPMWHSCSTLAQAAIKTAKLGETYQELSPKPSHWLQEGAFQWSLLPELWCWCWAVLGFIADLAPDLPFILGVLQETGG